MHFQSEGPKATVRGDSSGYWLARRVSGAAIGPKCYNPYNLLQKWGTMHFQCKYVWLNV